MSSSSSESPSELVNSSVWAMFAISTCFLAIRVYCKTTRGNRMWWDDHLLVAGWFFLLVSIAILTEMLTLGFGVTTIGDAQHEPVHTLVLVADNLHKLALGLTKTSFAMTMIRITEGGYRWLIVGLAFIMNAQFVVHIFLAWMRTCGSGDTYGLTTTCWPATGAVILNIFGGFYSAAFDLILAALPWKVIIGLQMKPYEKFGLGIAMSFGLLTAIVGILKAIQSIRMLNFYDPNYYHLQIVFWILAEAEPCTTIVACSIPALRILARDFVRTQYGSSSTPATHGYMRSDARSKFHTAGHSTSTKPMSLSTKHTLDGDADSEERYMPAKPPVAAARIRSGILRTTDVTVTSDERKGGLRQSEEEYELVNQYARFK